MVTPKKLFEAIDKNYRQDALILGGSSEHFILVDPEGNSLSCNQLRKEGDDPIFSIAMLPANAHNKAESVRIAQIGSQHEALLTEHKLTMAAATRYRGMEDNKRSLRQPQLGHVLGGYLLGSTLLNNPAGMALLDRFSGRINLYRLRQEALQLARTGGLVRIDAKFLSRL